MVLIRFLGDNPYHGTWAWFEQCVLRRHDRICYLGQQYYQTLVEQGYVERQPESRARTYYFMTLHGPTYEELCRRGLAQRMNLRQFCQVPNLNIRVHGFAPTQFYSCDFLNVVRMIDVDRIHAAKNNSVPDFPRWWA